MICAIDRIIRSAVMPFAEASISACASTAGTGEKPGAVVPHKRSNPYGTPGFVQ